LPDGIVAACLVSKITSIERPPDRHAHPQSLRRPRLRLDVQSGGQASECRRAREIPGEPGGGKPRPYVTLLIRAAVPGRGGKPRLYEIAVGRARDGLHDVEPFEAGRGVFLPAVPEGFAAPLADGFRIERELGRGGMATVYLAEDLKHGRRVAIKLLIPEVVAAIGPERFRREIEIAARLTHPHILPLHDSGVTDGRLYYVMPYIEESLCGQRSPEKAHFQ
jgi:hypothetical protein